MTPKLPPELLNGSAVSSAQLNAFLERLTPAEWQMTVEQFMTHHAAARTTKLLEATNTTQRDIYIPDSTYELLLQAIMHPASPTSPRSDLVAALGEIGGIWPVSCLADNEAVK